ncbi:hypothetical protein K0H81_13860 [Shewanella halotolerans]|nr:hypothetical protein K0H81_13860 [Shewanella halotolerans]
MCTTILRPKFLLSRVAMGQDIDTKVTKKAPASSEQSRRIAQFLASQPKALAASYSQAQLEAIDNALQGRSWQRHAIDSRGTFSIPFIPWRFYYVMLLGRNRRAFTRREKRLSSLALFGVIIAFTLVSLSLGLLLLYLLKSALGIELFEGHSLGIWDAVKSWFE